MHFAFGGNVVWRLVFYKGLDGPCPGRQHTKARTLLKSHCHSLEVQMVMSLLWTEETPLIETRPLCSLRALRHIGFLLQILSVAPGNNSVVSFQPLFLLEYETWKVVANILSVSLWLSSNFYYNTLKIVFTPNSTTKHNHLYFSFKVVKR